MAEPDGPLQLGEVVVLPGHVAHGAPDQVEGGLARVVLVLPGPAVAGQGGQVGHFDDVRHSLGSSPLAGTSRQERKFCSQYSKRTGACPSKLLPSPPFDGTFAIFFRFRC